MLRIITLALAILLSPIAANAELPAPKIVIVDINRIMNESKAAKSLNSQLETKRKALQSQVEEQEKKLKAAEDDLVKQKSILAKADLEKKQKQFLNDLNAARKSIGEKKAKLEQGYRASLNTIQQNLQTIIDGMAKEQGFNLAIPTSQLVFANKALDITPEALNRLDSKLPSVTLK